jgi:predicted nucleic acid-binding protein
MSSKLFVFDINAFISAALLAGSVSNQALDKAFKTGQVVVSEASFTEFTEVLFRKKFDKYLTDDRRLQVIQKLEIPLTLRSASPLMPAETQKTINSSNWL